MSADYFEANKTNTIRMDPRLHTDRVTPVLLNYIVEKIIREIEPKQIILFGSRARGEALDSSDISNSRFVARSRLRKSLKTHLLAK
ncbi:MAG: nucleotidyltransferase domain-containing protein [Chloroflexota bacterium]|nr:nucleotidyltransferase domain-containing protein [Chloroflexota bacterium]